MKEFFLRRPWTLLALGGIILLTLCLVLFKPSRFEPTGDQRFDFWVKWQSQERGEEAIGLYNSAVENLQNSLIKEGESADLCIQSKSSSLSVYEKVDLLLRSDEAKTESGEYDRVYSDARLKLIDLGYNGSIDAPYPEPLS